MQEYEKLVKQKTAKIGPIEESTIYATDIESLKNAIAQARDSAYWHGFHKHQVQVIEIENKKLNDQIKDLKIKIEHRDKSIIATRETLEKQRDMIFVANDLLDEERREYNKLQKSYDDFRALAKESENGKNKNLRHRKNDEDAPG